ncbi:cytochrome C biogenesis protein [Flavivirga aquatica]|uniref:Cytochrome C biogenesis protein n=1 Tax=Flavivirga aquatica TaxID=1849968 RepID=A0A1E5TAD8_9FLAO|nr:protein-disulfide reductase DsbD domain-containing protein [Flavivirga aquatica]OEK08339.1 cytochrome C biogenesis protein [Flavivirga aquatica]
MKYIIRLLIILWGINSFSQILEPVKWSTEVKKISDAEYNLIAKATIEPGWHLYSQNVPEDGPIPTSFIFAGNANYLKKGNTKEEEGHTIDDPIFGMRIKYFEKRASFKQHVKLKTKPPFKVNATVEFMVCDDSRCLPPTEEELTFELE